MTPDATAAIRARLEKATKRPWHVGPHYKSDVESSVGRVAECGLTRGQQAEANAEFIAHAPQDVADLLARCATLEGALRDVVGRIANGHRQSIGSIDNVRMVQFSVNELERLQAALAEAPPEETR